MTSVIASRSFPNVEVFGHGLGLGRQISDAVYIGITKYIITIEASSSTSNTTDSNQAIRTLSNAVGTASGVVVAFMYRRLSHLITSCSIGAEIVSSSIVEILDPVLVERKLPSIRNQPMLLMALHGALLALGFAQIRHHPSFIENILLSPLILTETVLSSAMTIASMRSN
jgi:hypothetical protein